MNDSNSYQDRKVRVGAFAGWLRRICKASTEPNTSDAEGKENPRAVLAALRRGLNGTADARGPMWKYIATYLGERKHPSDRWFFVVGALAAWHPLTGAPDYQTLGTAARGLRKKSESAADRFAALLACDERDLPQHLRQVTGILAAENVPVNWFQLLHDLALTGWNHPEREVQSRWARDFYRGNFEDASPKED